jgi:arylsulfatase A
MRFRSFAMLGILLAAVACLRAAEEPKATGRPNIVFILADDLGLDGLSCYGGERIKTPNLDALAAGGIKFSSCYANPLCGPSRCTLMTGRYVFRTGGRTNQSAGQPSPRSEVGIAKVLKQAGYATCQVGKWRQMGATPADWGFDEYITDPTAGGWYWPASYTKNGKQVTCEKGTYYEDAICDYALDFIRRHKERPFFLYYPTHLIHGPIVRTPDSKAGTADYYKDNLAYMDKQVGKVIAELDRLGLREKTLVLFAGDNGTARFGFETSTINGRRIHGQKGTLFEGGSRVPLIASWPGVTPAGKSNDDLIDFTDMFATFAELAGAKLPEGVKIDGHSFAAPLKGEKGTPREWVFVQLGARWYARDARWKLTQGGELFDLEDAPFAEAPVAADTQDAAAIAGRKHLQSVLDELKPTANPDEPVKRKKLKDGRRSRAAG